MALDLPDCGADSECVSMPVVIRHTFGVFVVDADGIFCIRVWFLDNPAMSGAPGLDFVEVIRFPDEFEIGRGQERMLVGCEHYFFTLRLPGASPYCVCGSQTMAG